LLDATGAFENNRKEERTIKRKKKEEGRRMKREMQGWREVIQGKEG